MDANSSREKKWYVLHALSGHENKAFENLKSRIELDEMTDYIGDVVIPTETVVEVVNGKKKTVKRRLYPGYILIEMCVYQEDGHTLDEKPWNFIKATPGLIGFVGGDHPVALTEEEVEQMKLQTEELRDQVKPKVVFDVGERVRITDGPFFGQNGIVETVDEKRGLVTVSVSIFGQSLNVDLEYWQVERGE